MTLIPSFLALFTSDSCGYISKAPIVAVISLRHNSAFVRSMADLWDLSSSDGAALFCPTFNYMYPFFADCAVCSQGYATTLSYYGCSECSEVTSIVPSVCAAIIVGILGLLFVRHMISIEGGHRTTWFSVDQMKSQLPLQSFKIIIISWQIVTQVRI